MPYDSNQGTLKLLKRIYAESQARPVFFLGAGCSADAGLPLWNGLRDGLFQKLNEDVSSLTASEEELEDFRQLETLFANENYWDFFDLAAKVWPTTYQDYFKEVITDRALESNIPSIYRSIWSMRQVNQVVTLNVDSFAERSFYESRGLAAHLNVYDGHNISDAKSFIDRNLPCVFNVHGTFKSQSRWIMTESERKNLYSGYYSEKFTSFMGSIYQNYTLIFVVINPQDVAISPFLSGVFRLGLSGRHFWLTSDFSHSVDAWAQSVGLRAIRYHPERAEDGFSNHSIVLQSIFQEIEAFKSLEDSIVLPFS